MAEREDLANTPAERAAATKAPVLSPIGFFWSKELSPKIESWPKVQHVHSKCVKI